MNLWGRSINYDELAHGTVVPPGIYTALAEAVGLPPDLRRERSTPAGPVVHAGVEHTYGYLFSTLKTPFGFKRARWVRPTLNEGLELPGETISPKPPRGTLLGNLTYLLGKAALTGQPTWTRLEAAARSRVPDGLRAWDPTRFERQELVETVDVGRKVVLHTLFVKFRAPTSEPSNSHLLVYWIDDAATGPRLISAFPVAASFIESISKPEDLGDGKPVKSRYNAYVEGLSGRADVTGSRIKRSISP